MTTRDEILAALTENPEGLNSKELAPLCPAAECDPLIVGRVIAALRAEEVIHPVGLRDSATVYKFGKPPKESTAAEPGSDRGSGHQPRPASTTALAPARPAEQRDEEEHMQKKPLKDRIVEALRSHGALNVDQLAKHADTTKATLGTMMGTLQKTAGVVKVKRGVYALKGAAAPAPREQPERVSTPQRKKKLKAKRPPAPRPAPRNGHPSAPKVEDGAPQFAINEHGELGIEVGEQRIRLDPSAFTRLRAFIESTEPVWKGA